MKRLVNKTVSPPRRAEKDIDEAVHRIYKKYGSDLAGFFSKVRREVNLEGAERSVDAEAGQRFKPEVKLDHTRSKLQSQPKTRRIR
jgi:hypothetical protein